MWNLLRTSSRECEKFMDFLETSGVGNTRTARVDDMLDDMADLPLLLRQHAAACGKCREAAEDYFATREIFHGLDLPAEPGPGFAAGVMKAIAARKDQLANSLSAWSVVPRLAARLACVAGIVLLVGGTWLYERPGPVRDTGAANQESLLDVPLAPTSQDDVLIGMAEKNP